MSYFIYLASASPRRRELLQQLGVRFRVVTTQVDEAVLPSEAPSRYVARLAAAKAEHGWVRSRDRENADVLPDVPLLAADPVLQAAVTAVAAAETAETADAVDRVDTADTADAANTPVLAADTAVVINGRILGKPRDREDAEGMLQLLSGRTHEVLTAVALRTAGGLQSRISRSEVTFRAVSAAEARDYWETGEPADKAGAYAIQGRAAVFISELRGSYSGVMGLPLFETAEMLRAAGWPCGGAALEWSV